MYSSFKSETVYFLKATFSGKLHLSVTFDYIRKFPPKWNEIGLRFLGLWSDDLRVLLCGAFAVSEVPGVLFLSPWLMVSRVGCLIMLSKVCKGWGMSGSLLQGWELNKAFWYLWSSELLVVQQYSSNPFKIHSSVSLHVITCWIQMHLLIIYFHLHNEKVKGSGKHWDTDFFYM